MQIKVHIFHHLVLREPTTTTTMTLQTLCSLVTLLACFVAAAGQDSASPVPAPVAGDDEARKGSSGASEVCNQWRLFSFILQETSLTICTNPAGLRHGP